MAVVQARRVAAESGRQLPKASEGSKRSPTAALPPRHEGPPPVARHSKATHPAAAAQVTPALAARSILQEMLAQGSKAAGVPGPSMAALHDPVYLPAALRSGAE